ncbi:methyltransferase family protein [Ruicaihuangia caeni]|uniref:Isoprenylcysteine carboxylmethyltransferase family protein n=1 Tax=Ruicaihuangia caeni TaxID=3042517 RepID=A0AAW6T921_9MICO|nr:isoprenylcysteine carboxylmethyltransferase family protein [Klugiella sp. YN-L-19]MDI2098848.1 isoprenylcysteine carboxylmethyltransferase family protein [Klugiella sp. YN-L-19]
MARRLRHWLGTLTSLVVLPGIIGVLLPWLITRWDVADWGIMQPLAMGLAYVLIIGGAWFLTHSYVRFAGEGAGTPSPLVPAEQLVVGGAYRFVRNPMYLAIFAVLAGQVLFFGSLWLVLYTIVIVIASVLFVRFYEEPRLERRFGEQYRRYREAVPAWWPRATPAHVN